MFLPFVLVSPHSNAIVRDSRFYAVESSLSIEFLFLDISLFILLPILTLAYLTPLNTILVGERDAIRERILHASSHICFLFGIVIFPVSKPC